MPNEPKTIQTAILIDDAEVDQKSYLRVLKRSGLVAEAMTFTYVGATGLPWFLTGAGNTWSVEPLGAERSRVKMSRAARVGMIEG